jgi:ACS family hexuronate transporter-like MFS transporter
MKIPKIQWVIATMLFLSTMINYVDRNAIGVVSVEIRKEFHLDETDYSHILTVFMLAYAVMYAGSGYIVDRLGTRRGFAVFISGWSIAQMLHWFAQGKWSLAGFRFLLGLTEPGNWPASAKAVAEWFPAHRRALGIGIFNAGSTAGATIAPPLVALLTAWLGWRGAFLVTGALGLVWLLAWLLIYDPPHKNKWLRPEEYSAIKDSVQPPEETEAVRGERVDWKKVLSTRGCYALVIARFFTDPVLYFVIFWLPEYLRKERNFDLAMVGKYGWVPYIFGDIGYLAGGWISGKLIERGWPLPKARKTILAIGVSMMPLGILAPMVPSWQGAIAVTCFMTMGHALWISNLLTIPTDIFKGREVATASGFTGMGGAIGGAIVNLGTGDLVSHCSYSPVFWIAGLMHPLALIVVLTLLPDARFRESRGAV